MAPQHKSAAVVSLAYEGGLADHRETVLPALERLGLSATFLMPPEALLESPLTWQEASKRGFELGVHSLYGVTLDGALDNWTMETVHADLEMSCNLFEEIVDERPVVFSYPGSYTTCASGCYKPVVRDCYSYAISVDEGANGPDADPYLLKRIWTFNLSGPEIICKLEKAISAGKWPIVVFEGIGTGMRGCDASAHLEVCLWLSKAEGLAKVLPVSTAAESIVLAKQVTVA
jgi:peptidoglycan-N-acetylglucosamine deacetylase